MILELWYSAFKRKCLFVFVRRTDGKTVQGVTVEAAMLSGFVPLPISAEQVSGFVPLPIWSEM